jgi:hypothetical protein
MSNFKDRKRKVEIDNLTTEQADQIGFELGKKIGSVINGAQKEIDDILKVYKYKGKSLKAQLSYVLLDPDTDKPLEL